MPQISSKGLSPKVNDTISMATGVRNNHFSPVQSRDYAEQHGAVGGSIMTAYVVKANTAWLPGATEQADRSKRGVRIIIMFMPPSICLPIPHPAPMKSNFGVFYYNYHPLIKCLTTVAEHSNKVFTALSGAAWRV